MLLNMLLLVACAPQMTVDGVSDELRTALHIEREGDTLGLYWFSNTPVPCAPDVDVDDPSTQPDEEADAYTWWQAQVATAFTREDTMNVVLVTGDPGDGSFEAGWNLASLGPDDAVVGWFRVTEASLTEMADYWLVYEVTEYTSGIGAGDVEVDDGHVVITTETPGPTLEGDAASCTYVGMRNLLKSLVQPWLGGAVD